MNSKMKNAGLGVIAALAIAASPFVLNTVSNNPAQAAEQSSAFTPAQKAELQSMMKQYILDNPKVLMDSVNGYKTAEEKDDEKAAQQALKDNSSYLLKNSKMPDVGNKKADVTVVEFFDYNCGYCKQGFESVRQGLESDKNLRFVFVDFPILSESSRLASHYALAAEKQGKYWELHKALMSFRGPKTDETIMALAKEAGLNVEKLKADLNSPDIEEALKKNEDLASKLAITGTPAFIIGDQIIRGYVPYDAMKTLVSEQRKKG